MPIDHSTAQDFIAAMAGATTQVTVVASDGSAGKCGVTVSAFASVSAEPPLVLVCINRRSPAVEVIEGNDSFCVNLLNDRQRDVADCFAGRSGDLPPYEFDTQNWTVARTGAPVLKDATASFDCTIEITHDAGTHRIFIGRVLETQASDAPSLAFAGRAYRALGPLEEDTP